MKNILLLTFLFCSATLFGQTIKVSATELAFLQSTTIVNFKVDLTKIKMGAFSSIEEWVEFRYNEVKLKENKEEADKWKVAVEEGIKSGLEEFRNDFNAQLERTAVRLKEGATTVDYTAVLRVSEINVPEGFGNKPVELKGTLEFSKAGKIVSVVEILEVKGFPSGGIPMRIRSAFRRAGGHTGEKIYLMYFK
ncbi:hypothetical protein BH09BAC1_BH09BAC1_28230 [soil metagenome]